MDYYRAGFDVVGIDIKAQPRYPFLFVQDDALRFVERNGKHFNAIHASPPCQSYTPLGALHPHKQYPDLVAATREALTASERPWVIENVMTAPLDKSRSIVLCGAMFGLRTYRHRRFESSVELRAPNHPPHAVKTATKQRRQRWAEGWNVSITGDVGTYLAQEAMGIDWMIGTELCEAIPPAYTQYLGKQLMIHLPAYEVPLRGVSAA